MSADFPIQNAEHHGSKTTRGYVSNGWKELALEGLIVDSLTILPRNRASVMIGRPERAEGVTIASLDMTDLQDLLLWMTIIELRRFLQGVAQAYAMIIRKANVIVDHPVDSVTHLTLAATDLHVPRHLHRQIGSALIF